MRWGEVVLASLAVLLLTSCGSVTGPTVSPSPTLSSVLKSGIAAEAESTWRAYFSASGSVLAGDVTDPSVVQSYLTSAEYVVIKRGLENFQADGHRIVGESSTRGFQVLRLDTHAQTLDALVCFDNNQSRILNDANEDITPKARLVEFTLRVHFVRQRGLMLVDSDEMWQKSSAC